MLNLDQIKAKLSDRRLDAIAAATGLHRNTIANIKSGKIENPTYYVLIKLSDYFEGQGK
jgi:transcriptional regulator with XRE-family HTH domain